MSKFGPYEFDKLLRAKYKVLNHDPLLGILSIKTDKGVIELGMIKPSPRC